VIAPNKPTLKLLLLRMRPRYFLPVSPCLSLLSLSLSPLYTWTHTYIHLHLAFPPHTHTESNAIRHTHIYIHIHIQRAKQLAEELRGRLQAAEKLALGMQGKVEEEVEERLLLIKAELKAEQKRAQSLAAAAVVEKVRMSVCYVHLYTLCLRHTAYTLYCIYTILYCAYAILHLHYAMYTHYAICTLCYTPRR